MHVNAGKSGSKIQSTPTKAGGDRYIPNRSTMQMEMANFLLTKENDPAEESPTKKVSTLLSYSYYNDHYQTPNSSWPFTEKQTVSSIKWVHGADSPSHQCFQLWASGPWDVVEDVEPANGMNMHLLHRRLSVAALQGPFPKHMEEHRALHLCFCSL